MVTLTCASISGLKLEVYSNDHDPPHFHASRRGEWEVRVFINTQEIELIWSCKRGPNAKQEKALKSFAQEHAAAIIQQFKEIAVDS